MSSTLIGPVVAAILVLVGVVITQRQLAKAAERTAGLEQTKVDGAAYDRAREYDREVVAGLRQDVALLRQEIASLRETLAREREDRSVERAASTEERSELRGLIVDLRQTVARQRTQLGGDPDGMH